MRRAPDGSGALAGVLVAIVVLAGCVDHEENASEFCQRNDELLAMSLQEQGVPAVLPETDDDREFFGEVVEDLEQGFSNTMRYAEDATKAIRNAARDADDSYLDVHATVTDDDADQAELDERRATLTQDLEKLAGLCEAFV